MQPIIQVRGLEKTYATGFQALKGVDLDIRRGEIFALLGPNGAGKTTLISIVCGIVNATAGTVTVDGHDIVRDWCAARSLIGLVPQELTTEAFESVWATVSFSRGLFGKPPDPAHIEKVLKDLSLWNKKDSKVMALSGGMKRRVMIAKALSHEPRILFLDEPFVNLDPIYQHKLREYLLELRQEGRTIFLCSHILDMAQKLCQEMVILNHGKVIAAGSVTELTRKEDLESLFLRMVNEDATA